MKNFIQATILTIALIALVSYIDYRPEERANGGGSGMKRKGNSGLIVPGNGELMAEVSFIPKSSESESPEKTESSQVKSITSEETQATSEVTSEEITEELREEHNKVDGMIIAFWHGVAAVLIGEASALLVALAWMKIRGGK